MEVAKGITYRLLRCELLYNATAGIKHLYTTIRHHSNHAWGERPGLYCTHAISLLLPICTAGNILISSQYCTVYTLFKGASHEIERLNINFIIQRTNMGSPRKYFKFKDKFAALRRMFSFLKKNTSQWDERFKSAGLQNYSIRDFCIKRFRTLNSS